MNYQQTLSYIHSLGRFSHEAGLSRISAIMQKLGNLQKEIPSLHIAGTNGKGSVAVMLANVFKSKGLKTGLYISPYIVRFNERISIDGEYISDNDLTRLCEQVKQLNIPCTEFEFITAVAFKYFYENKCDIVILETGLGGRFDATNIAENKKVSVITKIGLDHTEVLGDTIEKIAAEKCGIIKSCPTVTSPYQQADALKVIETHDKNVIIPDLKQLKVIKSDITGNAFIYKGREYEMQLVGSHQIENALCAIEAIAAAGYDIPYNIIYEGIKNAFIPARLECVCKERMIFIDGAHNPDAADRLYEFLKDFKGKLCGVVGMMKDKDYEYVLSKILPLCNRAVAVKCCDLPRAIEASDLAMSVRKFCTCEIAQDLNEAVSIITNCDEAVIVFGSLYLAAGIRPLLKEKIK